MLQTGRVLKNVKIPVKESKSLQPGIVMCLKYLSRSSSFSFSFPFSSAWDAVFLRAVEGDGFKVAPEAEG